MPLSYDDYEKQYDKWIGTEAADCHAMIDEALLEADALPVHFKPGGTKALTYRLAADYSAVGWDVLVSSNADMVTFRGPKPAGGPQWKD